MKKAKSSTWSGAKELRERLVAISSLTPDPRNARKHDEHSIATLRESLGRYGQLKPIVLAADGATIIAGNGLYVAARELGWTHIAAIRSGLSGGEATAFGLMDNRSAETSDWDYKQLSDLVRELEASKFDLSATGFASFELGPLLQASWAPAAPSDSTIGRSASSEKGKVLRLTNREHKAVMGAIALLRKQPNKVNLSDGECLRVICARFVKGLEPAS